MACLFDSGVFSYQRPITANINLNGNKIKKETDGAKKSSNTLIKVVILVWTFLVIQRPKIKRKKEDIYFAQSNFNYLYQEMPPPL